jgi:hypothetical protein
MTYEVLDPTEFISGDMFRQDEFLANIALYDWNRFEKRQVLVKGCHSTIFPPWAYMCIVGKLAGLARTVRYGNEHDNIVVARHPQKS